MQIWQDMEALGIKPDLILYSALIDTCAKVSGKGICLPCQDIDVNRSTVQVGSCSDSFIVAGWGYGARQGLACWPASSICM